MVGICLEIESSTFEIDKSWSNMASIRQVESRYSCYIHLLGRVTRPQSFNFYDSATIQLRYQSFGNCLVDEPQVGTPEQGLFLIL